MFLYYWERIYGGNPLKSRKQYTIITIPWKLEKDCCSYFSVRVPCGTPRPHGNIILNPLNRSSMQVRDFSVSFFMTIFFKFLRQIKYLNEVNGWFEINCWYICLSTQSYLIVLWGFLQALLHWITESQGLEIALDNLA